MPISSPDTAPHHGYTHMGQHPAFPDGRQPNWAFFPDQPVTPTAVTADPEVMPALTDTTSEDPATADVQHNGRIVASDEILEILEGIHRDFPGSEEQHTDDDLESWKRLCFGDTATDETVHDGEGTPAVEPAGEISAGVAETTADPKTAAVDAAMAEDALDDGAFDPASAARGQQATRVTLRDRFRRARAALTYESDGTHRASRVTRALGLTMLAATVTGAAAVGAYELWPTIHGFLSTFLPDSSALHPHHVASLPVSNGNETSASVPAPTEQIADPFHVDHVSVGHYNGSTDPNTYDLKVGTADWAVAHYAHAHGMTLSDDPHAAAGTIDPTSHAFDTAVNNFLGYNKVGDPTQMFDVTRWDINPAILTNGHPLTEADITQGMAAAATA